MSFRSLAIVLAMLTGAVGAAHGGKEQVMAQMEISSPVFKNNEPIPTKFTCNGSDINPPLHFSKVPPNAGSLALVIDDPDAPKGTWDHWVMWNIPPNVTGIEENSIPSEALLGSNGWHNTSYGGPCPPSGTHRYFFKVYALDTKLQLKQGASKKELQQAMQGHVLAEAQLIGLYSKQ